MKTLQSGTLGQLIILLAVIIAWLFALVEYYVNHVAPAQVIADGGWAALLAIMRVDFGQGAQAQAGSQPAP